MKVQWERLASMLFCIAVGIVLLIGLLRYALPLFFPFLVAWGLSLLVRPLAARISERFRLPVKLCSVLLLLLILGGTVLLLASAVNRLFFELQRLLERLLADGSGLSELIAGPVDYFEALTSKIGFLRRIGAGERFSAFREQFNRMTEELLENLITTLTSTIPAFAGRVLSALPSVIPAILVTVISGFYFCVDGERIGHALGSLLPHAVRCRIPDWKARMKHFSWRYIKAYLLLLLLTFSVLFPAFLILRVEYAFLLAILISLVDLLPILGVGTVLVPWAIVMLVQHRFYLGFGLLILYGVVTVLRQIMEPRLLGHTLGMHPLLALVSGYVGLRLLGVLGLVLGPILAMLLKPCFLQIRDFYEKKAAEITWNRKLFFKSVYFI